MARQEPIRVVVEKKGGCLSGCGTAFGVLLLIGLAVKYWYIALSIVVVMVVIGAIANSQQKQKADEAARRRSGPCDPWLNEVAVALADLDLTEVARNTGSRLGGAPLLGDVGLQGNRLLVYVNLFDTAELARQAEIGLRAQPNIRQAASSGDTMLKTEGPVLVVAHGGGHIVDEFRVDEVAQIVEKLPLPPALTSRRTAIPARPAAPRPPTIPSSESDRGGTLEQIRRLAELRDQGILTQEEFEAKKAEFLRRL